MDHKKSTRSAKSNRSRHFTFILYPESAIENWRDVLDSFHVSWAASPLHDQDVNADGSPKKPHWHIMISFESLKTAEQCNEISSALRGTISQFVQSPRAMVRYFAHMDNPDKAQYDKRQIECHGGFDLEDMLMTSNQTKYDALKEMIEYCIEADITEYEDLLVYSMHNEPSWFEALADSCTYTMSAFLKSRRHRKERDYR